LWAYTDNSYPTHKIQQHNGAGVLVPLTIIAFHVDFGGVEISTIKRAELAGIASALLLLHQGNVHSHAQTAYFLFQIRKQLSLRGKRGKHIHIQLSKQIVIMIGETDAP